jgi:mannosyltransferase
MLVVHPHFHPRRTGVTAHTEAIVGELARVGEAAALGQALTHGLPRTTLLEVWRRAAREPVVWHAHRNNELLWGLGLRLLGRRLRIVFTRHGGGAPGWFTRLLMRGADERVTLNSELAGVMGLGTHVIAHGVDLARFRPPVSRAAAWAALGLPGRRGVGVVGRVRPEKGQGDFVDALAPLLTDRPEVTPVLVGLTKPGQAAWAQGLRAQLPRLLLAGEQLDITPWYQGLEVVVQPSHSESFSLVLAEAMACGCAVVAARLPAAPSLIDHGRTGFLYPPGDVEALRGLLALLLADPALVARVGAAAAEEARQRFGIEHEARALTKLYEGSAV